MQKQFNTRALLNVLIGSAMSSNKASTRGLMKNADIKQVLDHLFPDMRQAMFMAMLKTTAYEVLHQHPELRSLPPIKDGDIEGWAKAALKCLPGLMSIGGPMPVMQAEPKRSLLEHLTPGARHRKMRRPYTKRSKYWRRNKAKQAARR